MMIANKKGNYDFLPGTSFLSFGSVAHSGFAIERAIFRTNKPVETCLDQVARHLQSRGRPLHALCGMEFRQYSSQQWPPEQFAEFNAAHVKRLNEAGLLVDGQVAVARTNVVINNSQLASDGGLHAFSYTVPLEQPAGAPGFVFAAIPEVRFLPDRHEVIASGETSQAALESKLKFILEVACARLVEIGATWSDATGIQLYSEVDLHPFYRSLLLDVMKDGGWRGIQWHQALPPIGPSIMELDFRSVKAEIVLD